MLDLYNQFMLFVAGDMAGIRHIDVNGINQYLIAKLDRYLEDK